MWTDTKKMHLQYSNTALVNVNKTISIYLIKNVILVCTKTIIISDILLKTSYLFAL